MSRQPKSYPLNEEKQENLILYLSQRCSNQHDYGKTKLCKLLYLSDFLSFAEYREPITGCEYIRMPYGPYPDGFGNTLDLMEEDGKLALQKFPYVQNEAQEKPVNLVEPDLSLFSAHEISIIDQVVEAFGSKSGTSLSEFSHQLSWRFAHDREVIPYESIFVDTRPLTDEEIVRGQEVAARHGYATSSSRREV